VFIFGWVRKKRIAEGFKWGKREHRFEKYMTRVLMLCLLFSIYSVVFEYSISSCILFILISFCFVLRLLTEFCHRMEKRYMDRYRFGKK